MSSRVLPRLAFRQSRWTIQRRAQSSTTEQASEAVSQRASQAKESAQEATSKASQGLSRVTSSAGNIVSGAANTAGSAVSRIGGRTGRLISWVQGQIPTVVYYGRVGGELARIIYQGRSMQPPTISTFQSYLSPLTNAVRNPSAFLSYSQTAQQAANNPQSFLARLRNLDRDTMVAAGVVGAETIGFFCIGEMIGRFKVVGYRGGNGDHH